MKFNQHLPHPKTISKWFANSNANCSGGFHTNALTILSEISKDLKDDGKKMFVALSFDEMSIRKHVQYLHPKRKFAGFINFGSLHHGEEPLPVASHAIVIMLNALNMKLTLPIAFFFITDLIAEEKAILIASIVKTITDIGIRVMSLTSDGLASNPAAYEILGANSDGNPYFHNPDTEERIYIFYDPPHMLKLVRNCLGDKKILRDKFNRPIDWKFIERLYRSKTSDLASHKLTKKHIDFESNKMNVSLATQTISNSVAESIEKLALNGNDLFKGIYFGTIFHFLLLQKLL